VTDDEDAKEYWTAKPHGNIPWFIRAVKNPKGFLHDTDDVSMDGKEVSTRTSPSPRVSRHEDRDPKKS